MNARTWSVIWCDEWDHDAGEPVGGGRCLEEAPDRRRAITLALIWARRVRRGEVVGILPGDGEVIVTDPQHNYVGTFGTGSARLAA